MTAPAYEGLNHEIALYDANVHICLRFFCSFLPAFDRVVFETESGGFSFGVGLIQMRVITYMDYAYVAMGVSPLNKSLLPLEKKKKKNRHEQHLEGKKCNFYSSLENFFMTVCSFASG